MPETLSPDHPNLIQAISRLKKILWAWSALLISMGIFNAAILRERYPFAPVPWIVAGLLILFGGQPAYLGLVAILWGLSIITLIPNASTLIGPDPMSQLLDLSAVEGIALGVVRVLLLIMAWNQFMFYRMLYGTEGMSGLANNIPAIPEMIPNKTTQLAKIAQIIGILGLLIVWISIIIKSSTSSINLLTLSYSTSALSIGLGLGVAFSPTTRRRIALSAVGIGLVVFVSIFVVGRLTLL